MTHVSKRPRESFIAASYILQFSSKSGIWLLNYMLTAIRLFPQSWELECISEHFHVSLSYFILKLSLWSSFGLKHPPGPLPDKNVQAPQSGTNCPDTIWRSSSLVEAAVILWLLEQKWFFIISLSSQYISKMFQNISEYICQLGAPGRSQFP